MISVKKSMKRLLVGIFLIMFSFACLSQQKINIDSLFATINNNDLYIAPKIGGLSLTVKASDIANSNSLSKPEKIAISSFPYSTSELLAAYTKEFLMQRLLPLLNDNERDLYANAMLYCLFNNRQLGKLIGISKQEWISSGRAERDKEHWICLLNQFNLM